MTHYADSAGCSIAYQVIGAGPTDVLLVQGLMSHLDMQWGDPQFASFLQRIAAQARLIVMDQRGVGLSDRAETIATVETRAADIAAVADAAGAQRPIVIGHCHGGPPAITYAATYPERIAGLVLMSTFARGVPDGRPGSLPTEALTFWNDAVADWGHGHTLSLFIPSRHESTLYRRLYATFERAAMTPGLARAAVASTGDIDVSPALATISAPTLVMHCAQDFIPLSSAQFLAGTIPDATLAILPGGDHVPFAGADSRDVANTVIDFVRTCQPAAALPANRFGAVVMTDIVDSTRTAAALGDAAWAAKLTAHDAMVHEHIDRYHGECLKFTGDGYLAIFRFCADALECARALQRTAADFGISIRCGVNAGEFEPFGDDAVGMTVTIAARLMSQAPAHTTLVSTVVQTAVGGAGYAFGESKSFDLKGVPCPVDAAPLLTVEPAAPAGTWQAIPADPVDDRRRANTLLVAGGTRFPQFARSLAVATRPGRLGWLRSRRNPAN